MTRSRTFPIHAAIVPIVIAGVAAGLADRTAAQTAPGIIRAPALNTAFPTPPGHDGIRLERLPGDAPGVFTCCLMVQNGPGQPPDVVIGRYDQVAGTFTPGNDASALNTAQGEYGLALEPQQGRYAVFGRGSNGPTECLFSARASVNVPFPAPVKIPGVPAGTELALGWVDGKLKLFYARAGNDALVMQELDVSNLVAPVLVGSAEVVGYPTSAGKRVAGATPITGPDGDVEGLLFPELSQSGMQMVLQAGLDPARAGSVLLATCGPGCFPAFGGVAGGRILFSARFLAGGPPPIHDVEVAWLLGDVVSPGGTADVFGAVSWPQKAMTMVLISAGVTPPVQLPRPLDLGHLALDVPSSFLVGVLNHNDASQLGHLSFPVPNSAALRGFAAAVQGLSLDASRQPIAWTNTAWLSVR